MAAAFDAQLQLYQQSQQLPANTVACDRHPNQPVTGFCASCLRERLAGLDPATSRVKRSPSSSGAPVALKSLFSRLPAGQLNHHNVVAMAGQSDGTLLPEMRRCKSFSGGQGVLPAAMCEPHRRSCDAQRRGALHPVHPHEGGVSRNSSQVFPPPIYCATSINDDAKEAENDPRIGLAGPVLEAREEEEEEEHYSDAVAGEPQTEQVGGGYGRIREKDGHKELRLMKEHIDLDSQFQRRKPPPKDIAGGFWLAASTFGEKLWKWRRKPKERKAGAGPDADGRDPVSESAAGAVGARRLSSQSRRFYRDAQSEVAEDAFGRHSCDIGPRFSLDAGRVFLDDPRYSLDEPRASWDGHILGCGRQAFPRLPPMLSVIEGAPTAAPPHVQRYDGQILVEEDSTVPGGTIQTREYYSDSLSQRRRRSLDRSSSMRRPSFEATEEPLPTKGSSNSRVLPTAMANEYFFQHTSGLDSKSNSLRDDCSENFEVTHKGPVDAGDSKKSRRWSKAWSLWGLLHGRGHGSGTMAANVVDGSFTGTWPELRRAHSSKFFRSNSSVSSRNSFSFGGNGNAGLGGVRRNAVEFNANSSIKRREETLLERNRSARYSPRRADNGLLRFYLTPSSSSRRSKAPVEGWHKSTHPFTSMLRH